MMILPPVPEPFPEPDSNRSSGHQHKVGRTGGSSGDDYYDDDGDWNGYHVDDNLFIMSFV